MAHNFKTRLEKIVDWLFREIKAKRGDYCVNPVTGGHFIWGEDPMPEQKKEAIKALRARRWFEVNSPSDGPRLPLSHDDIEDYRNGRGLRQIVGFYGRSLEANEYDVHRHPSFEDFARGLMACNSGAWEVEKNAEMRKRFPPRPLNGMNCGLYWEPPGKQKRVA
jgi:hypothetical protein